MKNILLVVGLLLSVSVSLFSCDKRAKQRVIAKMEDEEISMEEIDKLIQNSLFEYLYAVYDVRRLALNELINNKLIAKEARVHHISVDSITSIKIGELKSKITKDQYIKDNALQSGVVDEKNPFRLIPLDTPEGQKILEESYVKFLKQTFSKELMAKYKVNISLEPPETPKLDLTGVTSYKRGNLQSPNVVTIVSDFECPVCRSKGPVLEQIYKKFSSKVRFEYVHLSSSLNRSILFSVCAAEQGKFWEAHKSLLQMQGNASPTIESLISDLQLDKTRCETCMNSVTLTGEINTSMERLRALGITVTPTIIINHRVYYGEISEEVMGQFVENSIKKNH